MSRRPRSPGVVMVAIALVMVVLLAIFALSSRSPPPPSIAEFAPQAVEQITDSPDDQSSSRGAAAGAVATPSPSPGPLANAAPVSPVPRVRKCVGDPPRQIEDPQSPPCVPYWQGNNGGKTSRGVTADSVVVYIPTEADKKADIDRFMNFFNKRFEFYGRKLNFVYGVSGLGSASPETQKAAAVTAAQEVGAFASGFYRASQGLHYHEEASRQHIVNAAGVLSPFPDAYLRQFTPYMWQYYMESDQIMANLGEWACKRLVGRPARYGGEPSKARAFGVIVQTYYDRDPTNSAELEREMAACGSPIPKDRIVRNGVRTDQGGETTQAAAVDPVTSTQVIVRMKDAGATTIFCPCNLFTAGALLKAATNQGYFPEWVFTTYGPMDINVAITLGNSPPEQMQHAMGLSFQPRQVPLQDQPYYWAIKESDPSASASNDSATVLNRAEIYWPLLILASGIQMAGPNLTPESFEKGLQKTRFPNPDHPNMAGAVGFSPNHYAMTRDAAEIWWLNGATSPYSGDSGAWCYVDGGSRRTKGAWPPGDGTLFNGTCDTGAK